MYKVEITYREPAEILSYKRKHLKGAMALLNEEVLWENTVSARIIDENGTVVHSEDGSFTYAYEGRMEA